MSSKTTSPKFNENFEGSFALTKCVNTPSAGNTYARISRSGTFAQSNKSPHVGQLSPRPERSCNDPQLQDPALAIARRLDKTYQTRSAAPDAHTTIIEDPKNGPKYGRRQFDPNITFTLTGSQKNNILRDSMQKLVMTTPPRSAVALRLEDEVDKVYIHHKNMLLPVCQLFKFQDVAIAVGITRRRRNV